MRNQLLAITIGLLTVGCGGGGDSTTSTPPVVVPPTTGVVQKSTLLPSMNSDALITDIINMDLNNDGLQDLIMVRTPSGYGTAKFQALINQGGESFVDNTSDYFSQLSSTYYSWVEKIYLVDLNQDGRLDIVPHHDQSHWNESVGLDNIPNEMSPLLRQENGQFELMNWQQLGSVGSLLPIDIDNDGDIDLMSHRFENFATDEQQVVWTTYKNEIVETGTFNFSISNRAINTLKGIDNASFIYSPIVADLNSDGFNDIFYAGPKWKNNGFIDESAPFVVLLNQKDGSFAEGTIDTIATSEQLTHAREMHVADFNNDQFLDLVITGHGYDGGSFIGERNLLLLANSELKFDVTLEKQQPFNYRGFTHSSDIGDIDNDGDIDIIFSDITGADVTAAGNVQVFKNDGNANFTIKPTAYTLSDGGDMFIVATKLVDLNNDGYLDLVLGGDDTKSSAVILWNDGKGNF